MQTACKQNPNQWFPALPAGGQKGKKEAKILEQTREAIALCNLCPVKQACLGLGMEPENAEYGIWGGKLVGERMSLLGMYVRREDVRLMALLGVVPEVSTQKKSRKARDKHGKFITKKEITDVPR